MNQILNNLKNTIAPTPEVLWERGDATLQKVEIDPGRYEEVPFFDLEIIHRGTEYTSEMLDDLERPIGKIHTQTYVTSDGIDRATRIFLPHNHHNMFTVQLTTPWFTSIDGHNSEGVAESNARELDVAVVVIGAEHSARRYQMPFDIMRLGQTILHSRGISLAKTAQSNQLITQDLCHKYGLSTKIVKTGESRGAMEADAEYVYAKHYGNEIIYQDTTAKCLPDRVFTEGSETSKLLGFPGSELIGTGFVTAEVIKERATNDYLGTLSLNPNFIVSSIIGIGPALASGETGRFVDWLPLQSAGHHVTFDHDVASRPHRFRELYNKHALMANITLEGSHATLAHTATLRHLIDRIQNLTIQYQSVGEDISAVDWHRVHLKDDDKFVNSTYTNLHLLPTVLTTK